VPARSDVFVTQDEAVLKVLRGRPAPHAPGRVRDAARARVEAVKGSAAEETRDGGANAGQRSQARRRAFAKPTP
jgi:hypothetical protein